MARRRGALAKDPPLRGQARREAKAKARGEAPPPPRKDNRQGGQRTQGRQARPSGNKAGREPGKFKHAENQAAYDALNPKQQARYRKILANKGRAAANAELARMSGMQTVMPGQKPPPAQEAPVESTTPAGPPNEPPPGTPLEQLTPGQQGQEMGDVSSGIFVDMGEKARQFDPATMQQNYEMQFNQEMDRYRQNVMSQFDRRNQRQFEQQRLGVQQQIAERGLDPASPAAQELMRQQNEREDMARQEAMSAAEQGAYGIQQQAFGQARETALMPGQIAGQFMEPAMLGYKQAGDMELARMEAEAAAGRLNDTQLHELEVLRRQNQQRKWEVRNQPRSGGGGGQAGPSLYDRMEAANLAQGNQPPQQNPWATAAQGVATGFATGLGQGLARG